METLAKFEPSKTYWTRSICDADCIFEITVASRTEKTITTTEGKRLKINSYDGCESVMPMGRYSMAPSISADKVR